MAYEDTLKIIDYVKDITNQFLNGNIEYSFYDLEKSYHMDIISGNMKDIVVQDEYMVIFTKVSELYELFDDVLHQLDFQLIME